MSRRRALMAVDLEMITELLRLPEGLQVVGVAPGELNGFRRCAAVLLLEGESLEPVELSCRAPYVRAVYETQECGCVKFLRFDKEDVQED